jgi:hypothetical protein
MRAAVAAFAESIERCGSWLGPPHGDGGASPFKPCATILIEDVTHLRIAETVNGGS